MKILVFIFLILFSFSVNAQNFTENDEISALFEKAGVDGTFILYDVQKNSFTGHNKNRSTLRYIPASTFKITNSLIGLSVGAVETVDEILPYGGQPQYLKIWEKDMSLRDAIKISNVPIYQDLARRIGLERMQETIKKLDYGNANIGNVVDSFWLAGPLEISAVEQAKFLARLAKRKLPLSENIQNSVIDILKIEQTTEWTLYGKSGWTTAPDPGIGWWVGWINRGGNIYTFALNIDVNDDADVLMRETLTRAALKILQLL